MPLDLQRNLMDIRKAADRRATTRSYDALLPEYFPVKLVGAFISVDFVVGGAEDALAVGPTLDARVSPRRMLAWLRSMPSYRAGVPLRVGHQADAGLAFEKSAELIGLVDPGRPVVYATRRALLPGERDFFATPRPNLLLEPTVTPRSAALGVTADPLELVRSAAGLDPRALHWVVGPLAADAEAEAARVVEALPPGSRLTLRLLEQGAPRPPGAAPLGHAALARLEAVAHAHRLTVTEWSCRGSQARVGRGFFDVDRLTGQSDLARRAHDLITCAACPSRTQCHGPLDEPALLARLERELGVPGLTLTAPPRRTGPRAYLLEVAEPAASGDEAYLSHALGPPVAITLASRRAGERQEGAGGLDPAVLRRWYATGFLPVTELNAAAEKVLEDLARRLAARGPGGAGRGGAC
jgi:hypothetical protein